MTNPLTDEVIENAIEARAEILGVEPEFSREDYEAMRAAAKVIESALAGDRRDADRYRWLRDNVQAFRNGNASPHAIVKISLGIGTDQRERIFDLIGKSSHVGVATLDQAIDAATKGKSHD